MAHVRVLLLGSPLIERDGAPIKFDRQKAIALLAYLVLSGQPHRRDTLAALLWPEYGQAGAFAYLRRTLWALNQALGPAMFDAGRDTIGLSPAADLWADVLAFRARLAEQQAHTHASALLCAHCRELLAQAAELYRGDLLAGFSVRASPEFDEWQLAQAETLRQAAGLVFEQLARAAHAQDDPEAAIAAARRWVALDALHEPAQRLLIELYAYAGRRSAALRQYHEAARLLGRELGAMPQPETTALYDRIRAGELAPAPRPDELGGAQYQPPEAAAAAVNGSSVPAPTTALLGRAAEVAAAVARLRQPEVRLLTLTGPGGTGKTRLSVQVALELAADFAGGVFFVALAPLGAADLVVPTIAQVLSVKELPGQPLIVSLKQALRFRRALLVLDNFEQVLAAAGLVAELLAAAPRLKILVTSRTPLHISGEHELLVDPLALPPEGAADTAALAAYPSVQLFVQRAQAVQPDFAPGEANMGAIAAICRRLDGLPLAIELAAARIKLFSPQALLARLETQHGAALQILTGGARDLPERQQTLRSTIDWSYNLLAPAEQHAFACLAVFVGGCTLPAAEAVVGDMAQLTGEPLAVVELLAALVDKSLLRREAGADSEPRFSMLATIREYALERLAASGLAGTLRRRHATYMLALAETAARGLVGHEQLSWLARLEADTDNLRAALAWCLTPAAAPPEAPERPTRAELGLRLAGGLWRYWLLTATISEGRGWLATALDHGDGAGELAAPRAWAQLAAAALAVEQGDERAALPLFRASRAGWQALGDQRGVGLVLAHGSHVLAGGDRAAARRMAAESAALLRAAGAPAELATALYNLGEAANLEGNYAEMQALVEEGLALFRSAGDRWGVASGLIQLGYIASARSDFASARALFGESRALWCALGNKAGRVAALMALGWVAWIQGEFTELVAIFSEVLAFAQERGDKKAADWALNRLGWAAWARGDLDHATALFEENWATALALGSRTRVAWAMSGLAHVALSQGDSVWAATLFEQSLEGFRESGYQVDIAWALNNLGRSAASQGAPASAAALFGESMARSHAQGDRWNIAAALEGVAALGAAPTHAEHAARLFGAAAALREQIAAPLWPCFRAEYDRAVAALRAQLGADAFAAAWAAGQALPLGQAIAEAGAPVALAP